MERRFFLKALVASIAAANICRAPRLHAQTVSSPNTLLSFNLNLTSAGRLGFYIDYSERDTVGEHTFYVARTHGSQGVVTVEYASDGDVHNNVNGTLSWQEGDMSVKSFTVTVTSADLETHQNSLGLGEHRIVARLSNPTNNAELHFGAEETKAYGVIDNDVLAKNDNAVFYDADALSNGNGTQSSPYNNVVDAIQNIGSKRYLYGRGTTTIDGTHTDSVSGNVVKCLPVPTSRAGETTRIYLRNWSGSKWSIQGNGTDTNVCGFFTDVTGISYHTYKGIDFTNLNATDINGAGASTNCFAIYHMYTDGLSINIEQCTADNINGGGNTGAYMLWGINGGKVWRCTSNNIQRLGDNTNENTALFLTYDGKNISVQRCEASNSDSLVYHKRVAAPFEVSTSVRFCIDSTDKGVHYGRSGNTGVPHSYTIVQCNLFKPTLTNSESGIYNLAGSIGSNGSNNATKHWWCNNVFYKRGYGETAAIMGTQMYDAAIFNNIMLDCRKVWSESADSSAFGPDIEFADFNCEFGTTLIPQRYEWKGVNYSTAALLNDANPIYASNDINQNPMFTDAVNGDFTLLPTSPAISGGVDGTPQGIYLVGIEKIGANDFIQNAPPERMDAPNITILDS